MRKLKGTDLETGIDAVDGCVAQSGSTSSDGEIKSYRDENGDYIALYIDDEHKSAKFSGILKAGQASNKKKGDDFSVFGIDGILEEWNVEWSNNDVAKVSGSVREYPGLT